MPCRIAHAGGGSAVRHPACCFEWLGAQSRYTTEEVAAKCHRVVNHTHARVMFMFMFMSMFMFMFMFMFMSCSVFPG